MILKDQISAQRSTSFQSIGIHRSCFLTLFFMFILFPQDAKLQDELISGLDNHGLAYHFHLNMYLVTADLFIYLFIYLFLYLFMSDSSIYSFWAES